MEPLAWTFRSFFTQDVSRANAASAAARLLQRRRERERVDRFLAERREVPAATKG